MRTRIALALVWPLTAGLLLSACQGSTVPAPIFFYRAGPGASEVTLIVGADSPAPPAHGAVTEETDSYVRVKVDVETSSDPVLEEDRPPIGVGTEIEVMVRLEKPLGGRQMQNEDGSAILPAPTKTP